MKRMIKINKDICKSERKMNKVGSENKEIKNKRGEN